MNWSGIVPVVMAGLDPAIHPSSQNYCPSKMDRRVKPGGDDLYLERAI